MPESSVKILEKNWQKYETYTIWQESEKLLYSTTLYTGLVSNSIQTKKTSCGAMEQAHQMVMPILRPLWIEQNNSLRDSMRGACLLILMEVSYWLPSAILITCTFVKVEITKTRVSKLPHNCDLYEICCKHTREHCHFKMAPLHASGVKRAGAWNLLPGHSLSFVKLNVETV